MVSALISRILILGCGTLYPAYASFKAIRTKNVNEYVKWMMYWVVFAIFCCIETFSDVLLSWLPFYYEIKIIFVLWLLSPVTKGSSFLYKKFVHPQLIKREKDIDEYISQVSKKGYSTLVHLGTRGLSYATHVMVRTAVKGQTTLADHIRKSYSTSDLRVNPAIEDDNLRYADEDDEDELDNRLYEDNRELELRRDLQSHRKLERSKSDVSDKRTHRSEIKSVAGLSSLQEEEEEVTYSEEVVYIPPATLKRHSQHSKESKMDPYGTLPRTKLRPRTKLPKH